MYHFSELSSAESVLIAHRVPPEGIKEYRLKRLHYPDIYIPNRSIALPLSFLSDDHPRIVELKAQVDVYNMYLDDLESIPGFLDYFHNNGCCVKKDMVRQNWSPEVADRAFSKDRYVFHTDLSIVDDCLLDNTFCVQYACEAKCEKLILPIGGNAEDYPSVCGKRRIIWNWIDNGHDFCFYLWTLLSEHITISDDSDDESDLPCYGFDYYDEIRESDVEPQMVIVFNKLEEDGYISSYTIRPAEEDPRWKLVGKKDGSVDFAFVDLSFLDNGSIMDFINKQLKAQ